jgi:hypothetical protein
VKAPEAFSVSAVPVNVPLLSGFELGSLCIARADTPHIHTALSFVICIISIYSFHVASGISPAAFVWPIKHPCAWCALSHQFSFEGGATTTLAVSLRHEKPVLQPLGIVVK